MPLAMEVDVALGRPLVLAVLVVAVTLVAGWLIVKNVRTPPAP